MLQEAVSGLGLQAHVVQTLEARIAHADRFPSRPWPYVGVAKILLQQGQPKAARAILEYGLGQAGPHARLYNWLAQCYGASGNAEAELEAAEEAVRIDPGHRQAWHYLGGLYEKQARDEEALEAYGRAAADVEDLLAWSAHRAAGQVLMARGKPEAAAERYALAAAVSRKRCAAQSSVAQNYALLSHALQAAGREVEAAEAWQTALELDPDVAPAGVPSRMDGRPDHTGQPPGAGGPAASTGAGAVLRKAVSGLGMEDDVVQTLEACTAYADCSPSRPWPYIRVARILLQHGQPQAARAILQYGLGQAGPHASLYYWLAHCYGASGNVEAELEAAQQAVWLDPEHRQAWHYLGALCEKEGRHHKAMLAYRRAGGEREDHVARQAHRAAGRALQAQGQSETVAARYAQAAAISGRLGEPSPVMAQIYALLSDAPWTAGRDAEAARAQYTAPVLDPRHARRVVAVALAYLAGIFLAELLTIYADPRTGLLANCLLLGLLVFHSSRVEGSKERAFLVSLAFAPLIRILSLSLPLTQFPVVFWYLITSIPLFAAAFVAAPALGYSWRELGLTLRGWPLQVLIGLSGLVFGAVEYYILQPEPLAASLALAQVWWPALILFVSTGLLEEMIFRGLLQRAAIDALGRWGLIYVAVLFATLHIGYQSLVDVLFVLGVGLFLGWVVQRTGSLLGATLSHGLTNIVLFLVMPFLWI